MADILLEAGRSQASREREATFARALSFFKSAATLSDFFAQRRRAEVLIEMGRAGEAEAILQARPDLEQMGYVQHLLANTLLWVGRSAEARPWIDRALEDSRCQSHYHEFFKLRFDIRKLKAMRLRSRICAMPAIFRRKERLRRSGARCWKPKERAWGSAEVRTKNHAVIISHPVGNASAEREAGGVDQLTIRLGWDLAHVPACKAIDRWHSKLASSSFVWLLRLDPAARWLEKMAISSHLNRFGITVPLEANHR